MSLKPKTIFSINVQFPHTLAHHIKNTTEINDVAFNAMYKRIGFSDPATRELVRTKGINSLRFLCGLNVDRIKYLVKAIIRTGGATIGNSVSETAEHHFIVACHICKYWRRTSPKGIYFSDLVTTSDLFEEEERQMELKRTWDNNQAIFHAFIDAKLNKNFNVLYKDFDDRCSYICGWTNNPISYLMTYNLIPKDEAD